MSNSESIVSQTLAQNTPGIGVLNFLGVQLTTEQLQRLTQFTRSVFTLSQNELQEALVQGLDPNKVYGENQFTLAHEYARRGNVQHLKLLLQYKPNLLLRSSYGTTALDEALINKNADLIILILSAMPRQPANLNNVIANCLVNNNYTNSKNFVATLENLWDLLTLEQLKILLTFGLNTNFLLYRKYALIHLFARDGKTKLLELLLSFRSDTSQKDSYGKTALDHAMTRLNAAKEIGDQGLMQKYNECINIITK